ncbi:MAG: T9SS type A sorting domain-containing protein [Chitinophagaceae bacterium]|nr:T9SS type A sorting domain-containing protein [Chitinophagaceae bacterium]
MKRIVFSLLAWVCLSVTVTAQPTAGLMAYWRMDGNYVDAGPNFINGTNSGSTATTNNKSVANTAMAYANPGSPVVQFATHPVNANLSFGTNQDFSIDFSVLTSSQPHPGGIYDNNLNYGGPGVFMWNANGFQQLIFNFKNASVLTNNGALQLNVWKHFCCVRAGTAIKIYINGVLNATGSAGAMAPVYNFPARFGSMFFNGFSPPQYNGHNGKIDEFRIYNRALTDLEILILASTALPVKLTSFTGVNRNNNITLNWETQYEQNSSHYNIQRSTDGLNFTNAARVNANGNSNIPLFYSFNDDLPASVKMYKTVFYRLQSVDIDGGSGTSPVLAIQLDKTDIQLLVYPNPVKDILQVQTGSGLSGAAMLTITDMMGRRVYQKDIDLQLGSTAIPINISHYGAGIYYVHITNGNETYRKQFIKE